MKSTIVLAAGIIAASAFLVAGAIKEQRNVNLSCQAAGESRYEHRNYRAKRK